MNSHELPQVEFRQSFKRYSLGTALAFLLALVTVACAQAESQQFPLGPCHIEEGKPKLILGTLHWTVLIPNAEVKKWIVFMPKAPTIPGQIKPNTSLVFERLSDEAITVLDLSPAKRPLLQGLIADNDDKHRLSLQAKYQLMLMPRRLVEGRSRNPVTPLTAAEAQQFTSTSETINFNEPNFQSWLDAKRLRKKNESDLEFAWRAFLAIRNAYEYSYSSKQDRHISRLCQESSTDCGGLSWLFVGVLRANGVPARSLIGRWAISENEPEGTAGEAHVRTEFYAAEVGWIPVEISGAVSNKAADSLRFFGNDHGNFVTFHVDPDFVLDTKLFGERSVRNLQSPAFWFKGPGCLEGKSESSSWKVKQ